MNASLKKILRGISLELRHELEGWHDKRTGVWNPGDLERRLNEIGVWSDRPSKPLDEMPHLSVEDKAARRLVDGYLQLRAEAGVERAAAFAEFIRESAYTWANRLFALRCMEARSIIDEVILQKTAYAGRSLVHQRYLRKNPDAAKGEDDGLFAVLFAEFGIRARELPTLFDPHARSVALRPSTAALKHCVALLSGTQSVHGENPATDEVFAAPDAFGWFYQFYQEKEKERVDDWLNTRKNFKCEGADIVPKTALYTESYMVRFLVHNSLGSLWMGMYPDSSLCERWEYYVKDTDRLPVTRKPVREITFLDPAEGSGHFHLEAFDLFYLMYEEEAARNGNTLTPREISAAILNHNLYGIDIDGCSVQIATAALWMKAKERAPEMESIDLTSFHEHLIATNIRLPKGKDHLGSFLQKHPEDAQLRPALELVFQGLEHADELGALLQIEELVDAVLRRLKDEADKNKGTAVQTGLFEPTLVQTLLPVSSEDYSKWKRDALDRLQSHFEAEAQASDPVQAFFGESAGRGLTFFKVLSRRYDVVAANPPYMGSGSHGPYLAKYLDVHYRPGKADLYAAFLLRILELTDVKGTWAFVCPRGWLTLGTAEDLRKSFAERGTLVLGLDLGTGAFEEISGEIVSVILCVGEATKCSPQRTVKFIDLRDSSNKQADFQNGVLEVIEHPHSIFEQLPGRRFAYRLTREEVAIFRALDPLRDQCFMTIGLICGSNPRFVRLVHEVSCGGRWRPYLKTQSSTRWAGEVFEAVDWEGSGIRIRARYADIGASGGKYNGEEYYGTPGISATRVGGGSLKAQLFPSGLLFDSAASCGFTANESTRQLCCAFLNSPLCQRWAKELNGSFNYQAGDLNVLPFPTIAPDAHADTGRLVERAVSIVEAIIELTPTHWLFDPDVFRSRGTNLKQGIELILQSLLTTTSELQSIERKIFESINRLLGSQASSLDDVERQEFQQSPDHSLSELAATIMGVHVLRLLGHRWPKQLQPDEPVPGWADQDGVIPLTLGGGETPLIERVSERLGEDFPSGNVAALEREFEEIVGVSLEQWLSGSFFERQISQFKKRPIAWQLETVAIRQATIPGGKGKKKRALAGKPVFACLVYYHKLDADLLPKIRTQYVGLLRDGFETEFRTLERLANPTGDQQARRLQLEQWTDELQEFDRRLEDVSLSGFGPDALRPALRQYGINDALLSLTASWLRRLSETVAKGPLRDWAEAAAKTELHSDLPMWLQHSMSNLNHFCAVLGPKSPDEKSMDTDPTSKDFAPLVCQEAQGLVEGSLKLGCDRWWRPLDAAVLEPLRQEIKAAKAEIETIDEELKTEGLPYQRRNELGELKHELKEKVKSIKADHDDKSDRARKVRVEIELWTCSEAETWEAWLSAQPLFDAVASLDGQRPPPQSVADFITQESRYAPDLNDGVRVNIAPIQKAGLLHAEVLDGKDADKAIADRAEWRSDERRWVREGKLPQPGWWKESGAPS
jgi:hypothetical protein